MVIISSEEWYEKLILWKTVIWKYSDFGSHVQNKGSNTWARCFWSSAKVPVLFVSRASAPNTFFVVIFPVHKKCCGMSGPVLPDASYKCKLCAGRVRPKHSRLMATVYEEKREVVTYFSYRGDCLSSGGGCELASITRRMSHGVNSMSCGPFLPHAHFPSSLAGRPRHAVKLNRSL